MPRDIDIVPLDHAHLWKQGNDGTQQRNYGFIHIVEGALGYPEHEHQHEDGHSLDFLGCDFAHCVKLFLQPLETAFDLRNLLFLFHREEHIHSQKKADNKYYQTHRTAVQQPLGVTEIAASQEPRYEAYGEQVRT